MKTIFIILLVIAAVAGAVWVGTKFFGLAKDRDADGIPDEVEDKFDDIKDKVEDTVDDVKEVVEEIKDRAKNVKDELADVVSAVKGKPTKSKLNGLTKQQLLDSAKADFGVELDPALRKSNLVNKVYSLYNS